MSIQRCDKCGFLYENINFGPCPTCKLLESEDEDGDTNTTNSNTDS